MNLETKTFEANTQTGPNFVEDAQLAHEIALATDGLESAKVDAKIEEVVAQELLNDAKTAKKYRRIQRELTKAADYVSGFVEDGYNDAKRAGHSPPHPHQ